jgi:hypothetical protein
MSRDAEAKNLRLYDRRTIERNIKKGLISRKDYDKFLKSLDDAKDKGVMGGEVPEVDDDDDDDDDVEDVVAAEGAEHDHDDEGEDDGDDDEAEEAEPSPTGSNSH